MKISVISGGFDPIHSGHIDYINEASKLGKKLIICLNSDAWLIQKKGKYFLPFHERKNILENLKQVDMVIDFDDDEKGSCINGLKKVQSIFPDEEIIFCNGGDRNAKNIPESSVSGVELAFSVGGDNKKNSSSWILKEWAYQSEERIWGKFFNLYESKGLKVKELIVTPGKGMSFQRHFKRNEIWFVSSGKCLVHYSNSGPDASKEIVLLKDETLKIGVNDWHQITNPYEDECRIIEIQYGEETVEEDIERLHYYAS